jgi:exonuclease SbcC
MRLAHLTLTEFCQHHSLLVDFPIGITGIVGANGSGKSTVVRALQFALLGESGNVGTKADDLNWQAAADGGTGAVELEFKSDGTDGKLKRAIQVARASLKCGDVSVRSVSSVNAEIMKMLSVSKNTVEDIVFMMQGAIEKILFDRPADRKKNIHALFGIDKTEPIRTLLRDEIGSLNLSPIDDRVLTLKQRIETEVDPQLRTVSEERTKLSGEIEGWDADQLQSIVSSFEAASQLNEHIAKMETELHRLQSQPPIDVDALQAQLMAKKQVVDSSTATVEEMKRKLAAMESQQQVGRTRDALLAELVTLKQTLAQPIPAAPDFGPELVKQLEGEIIEARAEIAPKKAFVAAFDGQADAVCPTCQQLVANAGTLAEQMKAEVAEREQTIQSVHATMEQARETLVKHYGDKQRYQSAVEQATDRTGVVEKTLASMPIVATFDEQTAATMQEAVNTFSTQVAELTQLEQTYNDAAQRKTGHDAQVSSLATSIQQARQQLIQQTQPEQYQQAKTSLDFLTATRMKLAELEGSFKQLQEQRASSLKELQSLEEQAKQMEGLKTYQALCERTRTVLHYDNLPRLAMQRYLGVLNDKLNQFLSIFNVPFTCTLKNDLSVVCNIPDVGEKPADRLSGGQKVMLGIAFRIAVYSMFASDLGFMVLDEPTTMLDDDRVACVADMLETVGQYARNAQMQLIVITHEQELARTFDHVVEL